LEKTDLGMTFLDFLSRFFFVLFGRQAREITIMVCNKSLFLANDIDHRNNPESLYTNRVENILNLVYNPYLYHNLLHIHQVDIQVPNFDQPISIYHELELSSEDTLEEGTLEHSSENTNAFVGKNVGAFVGEYVGAFVGKFNLTFERTRIMLNQQLG
jgi:hypothetical protein